MAAINAHTQYTSDAISGRGVDRQLLGLKILANQAGLPTPDIFTDVAYQQSTHFCLSTSQVCQYSILVYSSLSLSLSP